MLVVLVSCDPAYQVFIRNDLNENIVVTTVPSIESAFGRTSTVPLHISSTDSSGTYRFSPGDEMVIDVRMGFHPELERFPYRQVYLISSEDTVVLDTKEKILRSLVRIKRNRKFYVLLSKYFDK